MTSMWLARGTRQVFDGESLLEEYLGPHKRGRRYAYPAYDGLVTNGDPRRLVTGDLLAPTLLNAPVDIDRMATLTALMPLLQRGLAGLPPVPLAEADEATCDAIAALYDPLDDPAVGDRDVKGSLIAKVLHRKQPDLIPLYDSRVLAFYRGEGSVPPAPRGARSWQEHMRLLVRAIRDDLQTNAEELARLSTIAPSDGPRLTALRILDILVWLSSAV